MSYEHVKDYRGRVRAAVIFGLGGKCAVCGYSRCITALHAHHYDPEDKSFTISSWTNHNKEKIIKEAKKCVLLCNNCHTEHHSRIIDITHLIPSFDEYTTRAILSERENKIKQEKIKRNEEFKKRLEIRKSSFPLSRFTVQQLLKIVDECGNKNKAAKKLGVSWNAINKKLKDHSGLL